MSNNSRLNDLKNRAYQLPTKMRLDGRMVTKGYRALGVLSHGRFTTVSPPTGLGSTSKFACGIFWAVS